MNCKYCGLESDNIYCSQECEENSNVFSILEDLYGELDIVYKATEYPWKVQLTSKSYYILKNKPGTHWVPKAEAYLPRKLIYEKDGNEYLIIVENLNIPFIVHARISNSASRILG
jgi:hypothetical protein